MGYVDLHVHSNRSDGTFTPSELVSYAIEKGLSAFALTDHDTTYGINEAYEASKTKDIKVVPGIECSTEYLGKDIHIVGLFINPFHQKLQETLHQFHEIRTNRNIQIIEKLRDRKIEIDFHKLKEENHNVVITRAHIARYLKDHNHVKSMAEAFERYLGDRASCFVPKELTLPMQAITAIKEAGGVPILAHPLLYHFSNDNLQEMIEHLMKHGLLGIEAIYSSHTSRDEKYVKKLAEKYNLLISGGSDFHGTNKPTIDMGKENLKIEEEIMDHIKEASGLGQPVPYHIRNAKQEDLEEISHIESICFPESEAAAKADIKRRITTFPESFLLADNGQRLIGFINGCSSNTPILQDSLYHENSQHNPDGAYQMIFGLDVLPEFRGQGVGVALMKHLIKIGSEKGKKGIVLTCKKELIPYYEKFGYQNRGKSVSAHGGAVWYDMILAFQ